MKNQFEVHGGTATIYLRRKTGDVLETQIDADDLAIAQSIPGSWNALRSRSGGFYVIARSGPRRDSTWLYLHRLVTEAPKGLIVDHINHDTLDNRRSNLRVVTHTINNLNLPHARSHNRSSGVLGVSWSKQFGKWQAQITCEGRHITVGYYRTVEDAAEAVSAKRSELIDQKIAALQSGGAS